MTSIYKYVFGGILGVVVLSVFLLSSGIVNPSWNPFKQPPSGAVLENAIYNLSQVEKMKISALVDLSIESSKKITGNLNLTQSVDYSNKTQKKNLTDFNLSVGIEGMELSMNASMIGVDKNLYLKINSFPPYLPLGIDTETLKNQWMLVDPAKLGLAGFSTSTITGEQTAKDTQILNDLKTLIADKKIFKLKRNLGQEKINGEIVNHYTAEIDKQTAKEILPKFFAVLDKYLPQQSSGLSSSDGASYQQDLQNTLTELEQNFDEIWKALGGIGFDVWIGQDNQTLEKIKFNKEIQKNKLAIEIAFSDFNKDFVIEAPTEFKPIEDILPPNLLGISTSTPAVSQ